MPNGRACLSPVQRWPCTPVWPNTWQQQLQQKSLLAATLSTADLGDLERKRSPPLCSADCQTASSYLFDDSDTTKRNGGASSDDNNSLSTTGSAPPAPPAGGCALRIPPAKCLTPRASNASTTHSPRRLWPTAAARLDDRRRAALGWPSGAQLARDKAFDALDALELLALFTRIAKLLRSFGFPPATQALLDHVDAVRAAAGPALVRLAALKDDPKMPVLIFSEADAAFAREPAALCRGAALLLRLPHLLRLAQGSAVGRVLDAVTSDGGPPPGGVVAAVKRTLRPQPPAPHPVLLTPDGHCFLPPRYLAADSLLTLQVFPDLDAPPRAGMLLVSKPKS